MPAPKQNFLDSCLFFNTNAFSRHLLKLAEAEFAGLKLSPAHASLLLLVFETPGISPKDLSRLLQLNPSTVTRFVDALVKKKLVRKISRGKVAFVHPTPKADALRSKVAEAYKCLYLKYSEILGPETAILLSQHIAGANEKVKQVLADQKNAD
ncbi:MAG TPA: MarR family transcriptional regulator [Desulfobacteraceae bacterium]|nr:MarR family transcriptional regulator [Desulfobacteraceae bacterium]|tara:strand:+ start:1044 stop:1502 length:459 start_codon:yes stop_codon:yes gene_type:complete